jgi:hypothetical protein
MISIEQKIKNLESLNPRTVFGNGFPQLPTNWQTSENPLAEAKEYATTNRLKAQKKGKKSDKIEKGYIVEINEGGDLLAAGVLQRPMTIAQLSDLGLKLSKPGSTKRINRDKEELVI